MWRTIGVLQDTSDHAVRTIEAELYGRHCSAETLFELHCDTAEVSRMFQGR